jgi:glc operon protein GlcG
MHMKSLVLALALVPSGPLFAQAPQTPPAQPPPVPRPTLAAAQRMLTAAQAKAAELRIGLSCVVVDVRGDLVAAARMDGVPFLTIDVAKGKATTSAFFGQPSGAMGERGPALAAIGASAGLTMLTVQGALPIVISNQRLGGIGCSGAASQQDEDAARAGLAAGQ